MSFSRVPSICNKVREYIINGSYLAKEYNMSVLTQTQLQQELDYSFPYHYLDLRGGMYQFFNIEYISCLEVVKDFLKPFQGQLILDAGCGDGRFCYELLNENTKVIGVDYSHQAIRFAQAFNPNIEFYVQDLRDLRISSRFDYVVMIETLEHLYPSAIPKVLEGIHHILKDKGRFIITVPSLRLPLDKKHYQHFSSESLCQLLESRFELISLVGYSKTGIRRQLFSIARALGILSFPLRHNADLMAKIYRWTADYYTEHLKTGHPEDCTGLAALYSKKVY